MKIYCPVALNPRGVVVASGQSHYGDYHTATITAAMAAAERLAMHHKGSTPCVEIVDGEMDVLVWYCGIEVRAEASR